MTGKSSSSIPAGFYKNRKDLTVFHVPSTVETIGPEAFRQCSSLERISLPSSVTEIGQRCFEECVSLKCFTVSRENPIYSSKKGMLLKNNGHLLVCVPSAEGHFSIPEGIQIIEDLAFSRCKSLCEVSFPSTLHYIGSSAFARCTSLKSVTVPGSCTDIADHCFEGCTHLEQVILKEGVQNLGEHCFDGCHCLQTVLIPRSVHRICEPLCTENTPVFLVYDGSMAMDYVIEHGLDHRIL